MIASRHLPIALALCSLLALTAPAGARPAGEPVPDAQAGGFSSYRLANGFRIILAPYPSAADVRVELLVKTGSKLEGYGETGMAHLLEHMLFKSAGPRQDIKSDLTALGATWNGTTTADRTNFFEVIPAEPDKLDAVIRLEADRFIRASFTQQHLASEMTVVRNELERNDSNPGSLVMRALQRQSFFWHGYGRPTIGARSDIEDAPFAALQAFHKKHYRPDNAALIVSGKFDSQRVLALAGKLFGEARNPDAPKITSWTREESRPTINRSELVLPAGKTIAASAWKLPAFTLRETHALDIANTAICDDDWGSLRKDLVIERKLAVSVYCGSQLEADYGQFIASASAGKDADAEALSAALRTHIEQAAVRGITQEQLERARLAELNAFERLESSHELLAQQLSQAEVAGDWRLFFWLRDVTRSITLDEANAALRKWLVATNRSDVLLRHAEGVSAPELPRALPAVNLVADQRWSDFARSGDPIPTSAGELAKQTKIIPLAGENARAALISRKTQGDLAWLTLANDYANEDALRGRQAACNMGSALLAYGGAGLNRDQLDARLEALQAHWSLGLGGIVLEAPRKNIDAALDLLLGVWATPSLPAEEFERLKAASIASLEAALKEPTSVASAQVGLRFDNYPAGHPLQPQSLEQQLAETRAVTLEQVRGCVADLGGVAQLRLAAVGEFTPQDIAGIGQKVAGLPRSKTPYVRIRELAAPDKVDTTPVVVAMPEKPNATVFGSTLLPLVDDAPDFPALRIATKILGGDAESRIWKRLREKEGLAYGAGSSLSGNSFDPRSRFMLYASAASDKAEAAQASLRDELAKALKDGFTPAEVERAKRAWQQERKTALRAEKSFVGYLSQGLYNGRDFAWLARYDEAIAKLDAKAVTQALRKYLGEAPVVWAIGRGDKAGSSKTP